jgi:hypothetical protein
MSAQKQIIAKYGLPSKEYRDKFCSVWNIVEDFEWTELLTVGTTQIPFKKVFINNDFKDRLFEAFKKIEAAGLQNELKTYNGCYVERKVRGRSAMSLHSWAMAIDFNSETEKLNQKKNGVFHSNFSPRLIKCFTDSGIFWGGHWRSRFDPMHFALYNG